MNRQVDIRRRTFCAMAACMASAARASLPDIVVGQINAQTGGAASLGVPLAQGAHAYFATLNAGGGILGRKIRLVTLDDEFREEKTVALAKRLIHEERPIAIINTVGAPNIDQLITRGVLEEAATPVIGPLTNSTTARERNSKWVFFVRAGLREEVRAMVRQIDVIGIHRVAVFYQNDTSGKDGLGLIEAALRKTGRQLVAAAPYERSDFKAETAFAAFRKAEPQAILMISVAAPSSNLIRLVRSSPLSGTMIIGNSGNSLESIVKTLGEDLARGVGLVQVIPSVRNNAVPVVKECIEAMIRFGPPDAKPNAFTLEGFISAKVLTEGLRRAGANPKGEALSKALEGLSDFDLGGYRVSFGPDRRLGSTFADVGVVGQGGRLLR